MFAWLFGNKPKQKRIDGCIACESVDVTTFSPQAYRCNDCGYEGGERWAEWQEMQTRAGYDDWSVAKLQAHAREQLTQARAILTPVYGLIDPGDGNWSPRVELRGAAGVAGGVASAIADVELTRQNREERHNAVLTGSASLRSVTVTMDALVDKGETFLTDANTNAKRTASAAATRSMTVDPKADVANLLIAVERCWKAINGTHSS